MGWETRPGGRRYLYRYRRVNGRPVKEYVAADDALGFGSVMADSLARIRCRQARVRELESRHRDEYRGRIDGILAEAAGQNDHLRTVAEGLLAAAGFRKHNRGEWRMQRELKILSRQIRRLKEAQDTPTPMIEFQAGDDAKAADLFAKARAGDDDAQAGVRKLIVSRDWVNWIGDLGQQATNNLIHTATAFDPVWKAGIAEKADRLTEELRGPNPSILEKLLVRRVVNGWVATHALELELAVRPPADRRSREYLDKALTRAQKRYTDAIRELARVRRLAIPVILAQVAVTGPRQLAAEAGA